MKNKLKVNIYNRTYNLLSEESQEYTNPHPDKGLC